MIFVRFAFQQIWRPRHFGFRVPIPAAGTLLVVVASWLPSSAAAIVSAVAMTAEEIVQELRNEVSGRDIDAGFCRQCSNSMAL